MRCRGVTFFFRVIASKILQWCLYFAAIYSKKPRKTNIASLRCPHPLFLGYDTQSFTGFTVIFFAIEVALLLAAFRGKFFQHLGYVVDLLVVSTCLYQELAGKGKGQRS